MTTIQTARTRKAGRRFEAISPRTRRLVRLVLCPSWGPNSEAPDTQTESASPAADAPSTKTAKSFVEASGLAAPIVVVLTDDEVNAAKSFRNLPRVAVVAPSELEVGAVVWARSLVVSEGALPTVETRAR